GALNNNTSTRRLAEKEGNDLATGIPKRMALGDISNSTETAATAEQSRQTQ
ncbi:hypothetical protein PanWU01x14_286370, partial [Parasponia andersonii]